MDNVGRIEASAHADFHDGDVDLLPFEPLTHDEIVDLEHRHPVVDDEVIVFVEDVHEDVARDVFAVDADPVEMGFVMRRLERADLVSLRHQEIP